MRLRKMQAPSTTRVLLAPSSSFSVTPFFVPVAWNSQVSGVSIAAYFLVFFSSALSEKWAPSTQQPSSGFVRSMPWQPRP